MLELMTHCHHVVAVEDAQLGFPEVTLPVVPGMEGCHWPMRKASRSDRPKILELLLEGKSVSATDCVGWLVDVAAPLDGALRAARDLLAGDESGLPRRALEEGPLDGVPGEVPGLASGAPATEAARRAIVSAVAAACGTSLAEAIEVQAGHSADFMTSRECRGGVVGQAASKTLDV
jgi:enoyl-CoA hydratase/carnithine racemase